MNADVTGRFADEAEPRLAAMRAGLQRLESGLDPDLMAELIRDSHTITGVAAAAGGDEVASIARHMEILLQEIGNGHRPASAALVDTLLHTVSGLLTIIARLREGGDVSELAQAQRAALEAFGASPAASPPTPTGPAPDPAPAPAGSIRCLLVEVGQRAYALPLDAVITAAEGRRGVCVDGVAVDIVGLGETLDPEGGATAPSVGPVVVLTGADRSYGFRVDAVLGPRNVVVKGLPAVLPKMSMLSGAAIEVDGSVLCVLSGPGLVERAKAVVQR